MKAILTVLLLVGINFSAKAQLLTNVSARFKTKVVCDSGKFGLTRAISPSPAAITPGNENKDKVTSPGHEYELGWKFVGRNGDKDVYRFTFTFTHMTKSGYSSETTTAKEVLFDGKKTTVFENEFHTVIIESPSEKDLKDIEARKQI